MIMAQISLIIQARTTSTRLPEKVLKPLPYNSNITVLEQVIRRAKKCRMVNEVILATTTDEEDSKIVKIAENNGIRYFRGSRNDVLSRYYFAAKMAKADVIVRITSDCPCIDPEVIDRLITHHINGGFHYSSNTMKRSFPHGLDAEVFNFEVLEEAHLCADKPFEREHVCPYMYITPKDRFKLGFIEAKKEEYAPDIRITLDTEEDYATLCAVFDYLYDKNNFFNVVDIVRLFEEKPWLKLINKKIVQKKTFTDINEELNEAIRVLDLQELKNAAKLLREIKG
jgi:spore coat polysaccharide biosynthesis protein SpsF